MILREDTKNGSGYIRVVSNVSDEEILEMNPDYILAPTVYSCSGFYVLESGEYKANPIKELEFLKVQSMEAITNKFSNMMSSGSFQTSLGFGVDNRRGDGKDDKDNVGSLIDLGQEPVYFRDVDGGFHQLTLSELTILKQEMIQDGLLKYQWKWEKEAAIMAATTIEELETISIN